MKKLILLVAIFAIAGTTTNAQSEYHQFFAKEFRGVFSVFQTKDAECALFDGRKGIIEFRNQKVYAFISVLTPDEMAEKMKRFFNWRLKGNADANAYSNQQMIDIIKRSPAEPLSADMAQNLMVGRIPHQGDANGDRFIDYIPMDRELIPGEWTLKFPKDVDPYSTPYLSTACGNQLFPRPQDVVDNEPIPENEDFTPRYASNPGDININIDNNSNSHSGNPSNGFVVDDGYSGNNNGSQEIVSRYKPNAVDWINTGMNVVDGVYGIIQGERDWRLQNNYSNQGNWGNNNFRGNNCAPRGFWGNNQQNNCVRPQFPQRNCWKRNTGWGNNSGGNGGGNIRSYNTSNLNPPQNNWNSGGYTPPRFNNSSLNGVIGGNQGGSTRSFTGGRTKKWGGR